MRVVSAKAIFGTGLPPALYGAIVVFSVTLFLTWGGLLWTTPRDASHVARFVVSYLAVIPVAAMLLGALRRFSWTRLITTTGTCWAIKLVITSVLFIALAHGTASSLEAAAPPEVTTSASADYQAASGPFPHGALKVEVVGETGPVASALVFLAEPKEGRDLEEGRQITLRVDGDRYEKSLYLATTSDELFIENADQVLHTAHLYRDGRSVANEPISAGNSGHALRMLEPGQYEIRCDNHASETTHLVVVDHPYATWTDKTGVATLEGVPVGEAKARVIPPGSPAAGEREHTTLVREDRASTITVDLRDPSIEKAP